MTLTAPPRRVRRVPARTRPGRDWPSAALVGLAVLLATAPTVAIVQGWLWFGHATVTVAVVTVAGLAAAPLGAAAVGAAQVLVLLGLLTALFTDDGVLAVLPGPGALAAMGELFSRAGDQVRDLPAPVPATPAVLFLVTAAAGVLAATAHLAAVTARAPASAGVPLLVAFAVPTAVADDLLPWWTLLAGALAFALVLTVHADRRGLPGAAAITAGGLAIALLAGLVSTFVGTDGRFTDVPGPHADVGLDPFLALHAQLTLAQPQQLLQVRGLPRPTYLRVLTLGNYVRDHGWQAGRPDRGVALTGPLPAPTSPGEQFTVEVDNLGYRDYWLPLYGEPLSVSGVADDLWAYDAASGIAYTSRPREEHGWQQRASLPSPDAAALRAAGRNGVDPAYLDSSQVDGRIRELAARVTAGAPTDFDRAVRLLSWFTGSDSAFRYSLQAPSGNGGDALVDFLTAARVGYCEQFASAMAVMLRTQGVPARVAIGFTGGVDDDGTRTISTSDAHAWVEVWFEGIGWVSFDPTPLGDGRTIAPPHLDEAQGRQASGPDSAAAPVAPSPAPAPAGPADGSAPGPAPRPQPGSPTGAGGGAAMAWLLPVVALGVLVGVLGTAPAGWRRRLRSRRIAAVRAGGPGAADAAWAELLAESADRGVTGQPGDTVRATARHLVSRHRLDRATQASLRELVGAVEASWYGELHPAPGALMSPLNRLRAGIEASDPLGWRRQLLPRSALVSLRRALSVVHVRQRPAAR